MHTPPSKSPTKEQHTSNFSDTTVSTQITVTLFFLTLYGQSTDGETESQKDH